VLKALRYAFAWGGKPDVPPGAAAFSYHRGLQAVMWALLAASLLETAVLHLLLARLWSVRASLLLFLVSLSGLIYLIGLLNSLRRLPILVTDDGVRVRSGLLVDRWLPLSQIASVSVVADPGDLKRPELLKASLLALPNTLIRLEQPVAVRGRGGRSRDITVIALRPDDPAGFAAVVAAAKRRAADV
jgi:hypothetical protein